MNELALKYGCNPNQKPSRIYMFLLMLYQERNGLTSFNRFNKGNFQSPFVLI